MVLNQRAVKAPFRDVLATLPRVSVYVERRFIIVDEVYELSAPCNFGCAALWETDPSLIIKDEVKFWLESLLSGIVYEQIKFGDQKLPCQG